MVSADGNMPGLTEFGQLGQYEVPSKSRSPPVHPVTRFGAELSWPWVSPALKQGASLRSPLEPEPSCGPRSSYGPTQKFQDLSRKPPTGIGAKPLSLVQGMKCPT